MRTSFPSRASLESMPIERLRLVDVAERDEELLLQDILNAKIVVAPPTGDIYRGDVPDIKSPEEEAIWQAKMDERTRAAEVDPVELPQSGDMEVPGGNPEPEVPVESPQEGETAPVEEETPETTEDTPTSEKKRFCEFCDSKARFHKKGCPMKEN